jgi:hypothetical protein
MNSPADRSSAVVLWLVPTGSAGEFFQSTIKQLAADHDAPIFQPHLTLGLGAVEQVERVSADALELRLLGVGWSEQFTRTLFVSFELSPGLAQLRDSLGMATAGFDPHLSLLYKEMPLGEKKQIASAISLPFARVVFDAIEAVRCADRTSTRADVECWETIASKALHANSRPPRSFLA